VTTASWEAVIANACTFAEDTTAEYAESMPLLYDKIRLELPDKTVLPSKFRELSASRGLTSTAKSRVAAPEVRNSSEDTAKRSHMLTAEAIWGEDNEPGSATRANNADAACVASAASVTAVPVLFKNSSA
jgi:hypothetical protein